MPNLQSNNNVELFKEFYGANHKQMELLIKDGRFPISFADIAIPKLNAWDNKNKDLIEA